MSLNEKRDRLARSAQNAFGRTSALDGAIERGVERFRAFRKELERRVGRGELTTKSAREAAKAEAARLNLELGSSLGAADSGTKPYRERVGQAYLSRERLKAKPSLETLQRETNALLRRSLVEQQIRNRAEEFEASTSVRPVVGGAAVPSLDMTLSMHERAIVEGDEAAAEWARRRLEGMRPQVFEPALAARIDGACDRPDRLNDRIVGRYVEAMKNRSPDELETFVRHAIEAADTNACVAAFRLAKDCTQVAERWVRMTLEGLEVFPDVALRALREESLREAEEERRDGAARLEYVSNLLDREAAMPGLKQPSEDQLRRIERSERLPVAEPGEPIGLVPTRRHEPGLERTGSETAGIESDQGEDGFATDAAMEGEGHES